ncbi:MAG: isoprenyl transferase [Firmicutes bacterium]|nr:isoprenyl transferase [Bacillota bacterium]MDH7494940.1 isoprenyl transferase [Bacillota bacterium]
MARLPKGLATLAGPVWLLARAMGRSWSPEAPRESGEQPPVDEKRLPRHVAIIMDGNGRWATRRGLPRLAGHRVGADRAEDIVRAASEMGIEVVTLYVFSTENWRRPSDEVNGLMDLLVEMFDKRLNPLVDFGARIRVIGARDGLPHAVLEAVNRVEKATAGNRGILVNLAINYGGRDEIVRAARQVAEAVVKGELGPQDMDAGVLAARLYTAGVPDPDLLIRTGGEMRISNFLLWQIAYTELYVTPVLWPDFTRRELERALQEYRRRVRRFGGI